MSIIARLGIIYFGVSYPSRTDCPL